MTMVNSVPDRMNLSFSGCGFLCLYHAGVAAAIKEYAPQLTQNKISGASAGAIVAAGLVTNACISQATSTILKVVSQARSRALGPLHPAFNLIGLVREGVGRSLPPDAYKQCTGRLQISLTRWRDNENVVVSEFSSNEELIDAIVCSCFIPLFCGVKPPTFRGEAYIDGGFTDNQPSYDDHTVTVSPFSGESDICPPDWDSASFFGLSFSGTSIRFTTRNLFRLTACLMPPSTEDCSKMCLQGFEDTLRFLTKNGMAPCIRCLTIQTNLDQNCGEICSPLEERMLSPNAARFRKRTTSSKKRFESECDTCCESEHMYNTSVSEVFPSIITKTFDEAFAAEDSFFKYLLSFRMFQFARTALGLGKLPLDMLIIFTKNVTKWMTEVVAPKWLMDKFQSLVDFILMEIEHQKSRYSRFSCLLPVPEMTFRPRRETDIELSEDARKELAFIRESDRKRRSKVERASSVTNTVAKDWTWLDDGADEDSLQHVVEYSHSHDAMYEFYYMDENNQMRTFELFNMANPYKRHDCHSHLSGAGSCCTSRPVSMVIEEAGEADEAGCSSKAEEADSGLSGVEGQTDTGRRDACCSPVRHFPSTSRMSSRGKGQSRRHTGQGGTPSSSRKQYSASRSGSGVNASGCSAGGGDVRSASSDSEGDGADKLFVPARRQRTSSVEYDGEPEPSDTDLTV
ncbi:hypothetical protein Q1695_015694 [Nippostrongylus brasiliensis]|nr:hypothetical protein Q1695_015694 [Nippostrongylus brasiliensis]